MEFQRFSRGFKNVPEEFQMSFMGVSNRFKGFQGRSGVVSGDLRKFFTCILT